jgi:hypothetical protein
MTTTFVRKHQLVKVISREDDRWTDKAIGEIKLGAYYVYAPDDLPPQMVKVIAIDPDRACTVSGPSGRVVAMGVNARYLRQRRQIIKGCQAPLIAIGLRDGVKIFAPGPVPKLVGVKPKAKYGRS